MKRNINRLLGVVALFCVMACSEETIVDQVIDGTSSGAVLRNVGETNNLDFEDLNSTYSILLEAQDAANGGLLSEVIVSVGFIDVDTLDQADLDTVAISEFSRIPASAFNEESPTTNGLPVARFSTTLQALLDHVEGTQATVDVGDEFVIDFQMVMTDGRVFNQGNATDDVTRTGTFSFFNAQFRYGPSIGDPQRLSLANFVTTFDDDDKLNRLSDGMIDTVFLEFDVDALADFINVPTVTAISSLGGNVALGALMAGTNDAEEDIFYTLYTAGADPADTIDFVVSGGSKTTGLLMPNDTLKGAYIIDNTDPRGTLGARTVSTDANGRILNISLELMYEPLGTDTVDFRIEATGTTDFDTQTIQKFISSGDELVTIDFVPQVGGVAINEGTLTFDIITDATGVVDLIGNESTEIINIALGN